MDTILPWIFAFISATVATLLLLLGEPRPHKGKVTAAVLYEAANHTVGIAMA
jgi:hypothetical protein